MNVALGPFYSIHLFICTYESVKGIVQPMVKIYLVKKFHSFKGKSSHVFKLVWYKLILIIEFYSMKG